MVMAAEAKQSIIMTAVGEGGGGQAKHCHGEAKQSTVREE